MEVDEVSQWKSRVAKVRPHLGVPHDERYVASLDLHEDRPIHYEIHAERSREDQPFEAKVDPSFFFDVMSSFPKTVRKGTTIMLLFQRRAEGGMHSECHSQDLPPKCI